MEKVSKTTAKMPKSRSKYLMQFLKRKANDMNTSPEPKDDQVYQYTQIYSKVSQMSNNARNSRGHHQDKSYDQDVEMQPEPEEAKYKTPKSYGNRRRVKKIDRYEESHNFYSSSPIKCGIESTAYSNGATETKFMSLKRNKAGRSPISGSTEKVIQIHEGDEVVEDFDEDEEWASIPSEEKPKCKIENEFYQKISRASHHKSDPSGNPYLMLFEDDLSLNKMIEDILENEEIDISDNKNEHFWQEEIKENELLKIGEKRLATDKKAYKDSKAFQKEFDEEISIQPNFDAYWSTKSPATRKKQKTLKYLSQYKLRPGFKEQIMSNSPVSHSSKGDLRTIDWLKLNKMLKLKETEAKVRTTEIKINFKSNIKNQQKIGGQIEKIVEKLYELLPAPIDKEKLNSLFKMEGKGSIIQVEDNPIFPFKISLDFLQEKFKNARFNVEWISVEGESSYELSTRTAFQEAQNNKNFSNLNSFGTNKNIVGLKQEAPVDSLQPLKLTVRGKFDSKGEESCKFEHILCVKNDKITRLHVCK